MIYFKIITIKNKKIIKKKEKEKKVYTQLCQHFTWTILWLWKLIQSKRASFKDIYFVVNIYFTY